MIPGAIPPVAPATTLGELFGPLAPIAVLAAVAGLAVLVAVLAGEALVVARRRSRTRIAGVEQSTQAGSDLRPAA
jgi:hypothetical protein